jgi:hypothetical protein
VTDHQDRIVKSTLTATLSSQLREAKDSEVDSVAHVVPAVVVTVVIIHVAHVVMAKVVKVRLDDSIVTLVVKRLASRLLIRKMALVKETGVLLLMRSLL